MLIAPDQSELEATVTPYRRELHAHCYRMLGSVADDRVIGEKG